MAVAEGAAKAAFGTRLRRVPRALFAKLSLPVVSVLGVVSFIYGSTVDTLAKWAAASDPTRGAELLSFGSLSAHECAFKATTALGALMYACTVYRDPGSVPAGYAPDPESSLAHGGVVELKRKGGRSEEHTSELQSPVLR
jgi:palmitoyltransferase